MRSALLLTNPLYFGDHMMPQGVTCQNSVVSVRQLHGHCLKRARFDDPRIKRPRFDSTARMEPFLIMARSTRGAASAKIVEDVTAAPGVFAFGELLAMPSIADLANQPETIPAYRKLELFAYGTIEGYQRESSTLPDFSPAQITKLKQLTLVTAASNARGLSYSELMPLLQVTSVRELEDLIIDVMYAGLLGGRLDHQAGTLHIEWMAGRDVGKGEVEVMKSQLQNWFQAANSVLSDLDCKISTAQSEALASRMEANDYRDSRDAAFLQAHAAMMQEQGTNKEAHEKQTWNTKKTVWTKADGGQ